MAGDSDKTLPSFPKKSPHGKGDGEKGNGSSSPRTVVVECVTAIIGEVLKPTKMNYHKWTLKKQVHLEDMEIWDVVETSRDEHSKDRCGHWLSSSVGCRRR